MHKEYRLLEGFQDVKPLYFISNEGYVASMSNKAKGRLMTSRFTSRGYVTVSLIRETNVTYPFLVHRLVAHAFLGECPEGYQVNHKNGIKIDNRIENLEYLTSRDNIRHAFENNLVNVRRGEDANSKLLESEVLEIRRLYDLGVETKVLSQQFGISLWHVNHIVVGDVWKHAGGVIQAKGTNYKPMQGVKHPLSKLTEEKVIKARAMRKQGLSLTKIANHFGVNSGTVHNAIVGVTWAHVKEGLA